MELNLESYTPLTPEDRELLASCGYAEDHMLAQRTVFVGRLQRFLNAYDPDTPVIVDGKYGPDTDVKTRIWGWSPAAMTFIESERNRVR
jgi:hypothetical protein